MRELPMSGRFAWWGTAWLRGLVGADDLLDALGTSEHLHLADGVPGVAEPEPLLSALLEVRRRAGDALGAAFPATGDPVGLGGPRALNDAALEAGEAVIGPGFALVPLLVGESVVWQWHDAALRQLVDVGEADRALRAAVVATADALAALDVARWSPDAVDLLIDQARPAPTPAPPGTPPRCVELAARSQWALDLAGVALADDGAAISAAEAARRRDALLPLERAARRGLVAACSPEVWPPAG